MGAERFVLGGGGPILVDISCPLATLLLKYLVPIYWKQGIFGLEKEDSKSIKDQNGAPNVVPFFGAIFTIT